MFGLAPALSRASAMWAMPAITSPLCFFGLKEQTRCSGVSTAPTVAAFTCAEWRIRNVEANSSPKKTEKHTRWGEYLDHQMKIKNFSQDSWWFLKFLQQSFVSEGGFVPTSNLLQKSATFDYSLWPNTSTRHLSGWPCEEDSSHSGPPCQHLPYCWPVWWRCSPTSWTEPDPAPSLHYCPAHSAFQAT